MNFFCKFVTEIAQYRMTKLSSLLRYFVLTTRVIVLFGILVTITSFSIKKTKFNNSYESNKDKECFFKSVSSTEINSLFPCPSKNNKFDLLYYEFEENFTRSNSRKKNALKNIIEFAKYDTFIKQFIASKIVYKELTSKYQSYSYKALYLKNSVLRL